MAPEFKWQYLFAGDPRIVVYDWATYYTPFWPPIARDACIAASDALKLMSPGIDCFPVTFQIEKQRNLVFWKDAVAKMSRASTFCGDPDDDGIGFGTVVIATRADMAVLKRLM